MVREARNEELDDRSRERSYCEQHKRDPHTEAQPFSVHRNDG